jgi:hypothetical protein
MTNKIFSRFYGGNFVAGFAFVTGLTVYAPIVAATLTTDQST